MGLQGSRYLGDWHCIMNTPICLANHLQEGELLVSSLQFPVPLIFESKRFQNRGTTEEQFGISRVKGKGHNVDLITHDSMPKTDMGMWCLLSNQETWGWLGRTEKYIVTYCGSKIPHSLNFHETRIRNILEKKTSHSQLKYLMTYKRKALQTKLL